MKEIEFKFAYAGKNGLPEIRTRKGSLVSEDETFCYVRVTDINQGSAFVSSIKEGSMMYKVHKSDIISLEDADEPTEGVHLKEYPKHAHPPKAIFEMMQEASKEAKPAPKKKRRRRTKAEMEAARSTEEK